MSRSPKSKGGSGYGGSGGYGASRFDKVESFGTSYTTPGWQRAQATAPATAAARPAADSARTSRHSRSGGFRATSAGPLIEGELVAKSTGTVSDFSLGDRVFHQKFGYGHVVTIEGNKLTIDFDKAGEKKVVDSFVERA